MTNSRRSWTIAAIQSGGRTMSLEDNRKLIQRYFNEVWNEGNVDALDELLTHDYVNHSPGIPNPRPGPADLKPIVLAMRRGISGLHYDILDLVVAEDKVMAYVRMTGVHDAELFGMPASGRRIDVRQMQIEWICDG